MKRIEQIGLTIYKEPIPHVRDKELKEALDNAGMSNELFDKLFGVQTGIVVDGEMCLYDYDVEAVLERMMSGKVTGTQLFWD